MSAARQRLPGLLLAAAALALCLLGGRAPARAQGPAGPNILLILSDDHSAAHLGCYGNREIRTPNLDRLAAAGLRFDRAYVSAPQCVPSRASLMTGRSAVALGMTRFSAPLPAEARTYPEILRSRGYFTGVAGRSYHLDGSGRMPEESRRVFEARSLRTFPRRLDYVKSSGNRTEALAQYREFLDAVPRGRPFFLQLCFSDPHRPLDRNAVPQPHDPKALTLPAHFPDTPLVREDFARYYDEISRLDGDIGTVLEELEKRGLAGETLVAFMGDNGGAIFRGKGTLYEFGVRVPLLVRWPGRVRPGAAEELVSGEDLAPTFLEAVGAPVPAEMTGRSFLKRLRGEPFAGREQLFAERGPHGSGLPQNSAVFDLGRCVVTRTHKLIYNALWQIPYWPVDFAGDPMWRELVRLHGEGKLDPRTARLYFAPQRPMFELYDLRSDPAELNNLAGKPETAALERELKGKLQEWMILERDYLPLPIPPPAR